MSIINSILKRDDKKVLIGVPCKDQLYSHFAYCLQAMIHHHAILGLKTQVEFNMGTLISNQRENLAKKAVAEEATHILFLDSDMMFPADTCMKLLMHKLPFVACNYSTRALPLKGVAYSGMGNWQSNISGDEEGLIEVEGVGFGCVLIETEILRCMYPPLFPITYTVESDDYLGEDMNFCKRITNMGVQMFIDADLSKQIKHLGVTAFSL